MWDIKNVNETISFISGFNLFGSFTLFSWWPADTAYPWLYAGLLCPREIEAIDLTPISY